MREKQIARCYPERRVYEWAAPDKQYTLPKAMDIMRRARKQMKEPANPARWATFSLVMEMLAYLHHERDVTTFPGPKLHKLLIEAAIRCGWNTQPSDIKRSLTPTPTRPGFLMCQRCHEERPESSFFKRPTSGQAEVYGWRNVHKHKIKVNYCTPCRESIQQAKRQRGERTQAKVATQQFEKLRKLKTITARSEAQALAYTTYADLLRKAERAAKLGKSPFHRVKEQLVMAARIELERRLDEADLGDLLDGDTHWTRLLTPAQLKQIEAHHKHWALERARGRPPAL